MAFLGDSVLSWLKTATAYQPPAGHTSRSEVSKRHGFSRLQRNSDSAVSGWSRYFTHTHWEQRTGSDLRAVGDGVGLLGAEVAQDVCRLPLARVVNPRTPCREKPYHILRPVCRLFRFEDRALTSNALLNSNRRK